jgi:acyl carrier protein
VEEIMILERVKAILVEELDLEEDTITLDSRIKDDLGADSLDLFELINKIEDELDVTIEEEDYGNVKLDPEAIKAQIRMKEIQRQLCMRIMFGR